MTGNNLARLLNTETPFFNISSLQSILNLSRESARTTANRLVKRGILVRIHRGLYTLAGRDYSLFALANALYQPSVISMETALNYWGVTVQVPQIIYSVADGSYRIEIDNTQFVYRKINPPLLRFGQVKKEGFYITEPEKSLLDTLYMKAKGLTEILPEDVEMETLDKDKLNHYVYPYPNVVKKMLKTFQEVPYEAK